MTIYPKLKKPGSLINPINFIGATAALAIVMIFAPVASAQNPQIQPGNQPATNSVNMNNDINFSGEKTGSDVLPIEPGQAINLKIPYDIQSLETEVDKAHFNCWIEEEVNGDNNSRTENFFIELSDRQASGVFETQLIPGGNGEYRNVSFFNIIQCGLYLWRGDNTNDAKSDPAGDFCSQTSSHYAESFRCPSEPSQTLVMIRFEEAE